MHFHNVAHHNSLGPLSDLGSYSLRMWKMSRLGGTDLSKRGVEKRHYGRGAFKPYRKPTQVDKRKYAKVNG